MERFHCGWLTKAPPENRMKRSFPFKSHWRRRFFVLYAPPSSMNSFTTDRHAFLEYYDSETCVRRRGKPIDLNLCEEIQDHLNSTYYRFLFSLRTPRRTYYLATESEGDMDVWVDKLSTICGFNSNEPVAVAPTPPVPTPTPRNPLSPRPSLTPNGVSSPLAPPKTPITNVTNRMESVKPSPAPKPKFDHPSFELDDERPMLAPKQRIASLALNDRNGDRPPALAPKQQKQNPATDSENGVSGLSTSSPEHHNLHRNTENGGSAEDIYNHPTTRHRPQTDHGEGMMDETYSKGPTSRPVHPESGSEEDEDNREDDYQYPKSYVVPCNQSADDNASGSDDARERYENIATLVTGNPDGEDQREVTYDRLPTGRRPSKDDIYDFPSAKLVDSLPPPAAHQPVNVHGYVNAPSAAVGSPGYVNAPPHSGCLLTPGGYVVATGAEKDAYDFEISVVPTSRTRSFKSRTSRCESSARPVVKPPIARKPSNTEELEDEDSDTD